MNLIVFTNDRYKLLKWISDNQIEIKNSRYLISSQQEIADALHFSKKKTNLYINELINLKYLKKYKKRGKYAVTLKGNEVINVIECEKCN